MPEHDDSRKTLPDPIKGTDEDTIAGVEAIQKTLRETGDRTILVYGTDTMVPRRLTRKEAVELLDGLGRGIEPCIVTARVRGSDLVIRTIEWMGDQARPGQPRSPTEPQGDNE